MASSTTSPTSSRPARAVAPAFESVLCGIDGSRAAFEAAEQAAILAEPGGTVDLVAVVDQAGAGLAATATLGRPRAEAALERARRALREHAVTATTELVHGAANQQLLPAGDVHDLLALGSHGTSRAAGIALGHTASVAVHEARTSVLLARKPPPGGVFPGTILVASDGSHSGLLALETAHKIGLAHDAHLHAAHIQAPGHSRRALVGEQTVRLLGEDTPLHCLDGDAVDQLLALSAELHPSLMVLGSRGLTGVSALGSVSERLAHRAPCSVLVVRPCPERTPR